MRACVHFPIWTVLIFFLTFLVLGTWFRSHNISASNWAFSPGTPELVLPILMMNLPLYHNHQIRTVNMAASYTGLWVCCTYLQGNYTGASQEIQSMNKLILQSSLILFLWLMPLPTSLTIRTPSSTCPNVTWFMRWFSPLNNIGVCCLASMINSFDLTKMSQNLV